jgi:hypothetical protein
MQNVGGGPPKTARTPDVIAAAAAIDPVHTGAHAHLQARRSALALRSPIGASGNPLIPRIQSAPDSAVGGDR